jgi:hypothetical protein
MECILQDTEDFENREGKNSIKIATVLHIYITFGSRSLAKKKNFFLLQINATPHIKYKTDLNNITANKHNIIIICDIMFVNCDVMTLFRRIILYLIRVGMSLQSV